ncbi:MAG: DUF1552 domain-containing protein [Pedosphaera sp.]|nr:DUF1552 domain-containing protein [Pedosphaera sp.]
MKTSNPIHRRTFLRGLGAAMALPLLDSMVPLRALGGTAGRALPKRMAVLYVPNGVVIPNWVPKTTGFDFDLPPILQPLAPYKQDLIVMSGLTQDGGRGNGDGPGDHARAASTFLTGTQALKSEGSQIRAGMSADQIAVDAVAQETRLPSLELGTEKGRQAGKCDSGYSCAYSNNISWRNETTPLTKETNPRLVFERLFGNGDSREMRESLARRQRLKKSILDFVHEDARRLDGKVGGADQHKLGEYLTAVREIEKRVERAEREASSPIEIPSGTEKPEGMPESYEEHIRLMADMMVLAFQTDVTRVATFMLANEGSNKPYRFIGVNDGHHDLSHHQNDANRLSKITQINRFHVTQFAYLLRRLKSIREGGGTLLDNSMILYGSGISDGNRHNDENLPLVLAGRGGGTILTGRHVAYAEETPMNNLLLSMVRRMGSTVDRFGDSTGPLPGLEG